MPLRCVSERGSRSRVVGRAIAVVPETKMGTQVLGAPVKRKEDPNLLTGNGKFTADLELPGMAHVAILHSPEAHAKIKKLNTSVASRLPGVIRIFTGADIAAKM